MKMSITKKLSKKSNGSAITEFLVFTLPFFTAFLILITLVQYKAISISESNNLARQVVRAFVTSPNDQLAFFRVNQLLELYQNSLSPAAKAARPISADVKCQSYPCLSPGNKVTATISVGSDQRSSATEFVDLWR